MSPFYVAYLTSMGLFFTSSVICLCYLACRPPPEPRDPSRTPPVAPGLRRLLLVDLETIIEDEEMRLQ